MHSKYLLTVFLDGIKPQSLRFMPFISSLNSQRNIKTDLGYSVTCHASMYTGVYPEKHKIWFYWLKDFVNSPYKWLRQSGLDSIPDNDFVKFFLYMAAKELSQTNTSRKGVTYIRASNFRNWSQVSLSESKSVDEKGYVKDYPTIFEILEREGIRYEKAGLVKTGSSIKLVESHKFDNSCQWKYLFIGDVDPISHLYGQSSNKCIHLLKTIDDLVSSKYYELQKSHKNVDIMCFSDHGHIDAPFDFKIRDFFALNNSNIDNFVYIIDATFARFWPRNELEKDEILRVLNELTDKGSILSESDYNLYKVKMPDNRYGEIIYLIDPPYKFSNPFSPFLKYRNYIRQVSMHGYRPEIPGMSGIFASSLPIAKTVKEITLQDVFVSILDNLGLPIPSYSDGEVIWEK